MAVGGDIARTLVAKCLAAVDTGAPLDVFGQIVAEAVAAPEALAALVPMPLDPQYDDIVHHSDELFVALGVFPAGFRTGLHDHGMPAVIGVWSGYEDNHLYHRSEHGLLFDGVTRVEAGEVLTLDAGVVHDVHSPPDRWSGALHVYVGDLLGTERHGWDVPTSAPAAFDNAELERRWREAATATGLLR